MSDPKKILIVEDDPEISELLIVVLEENGYDVEICADGKNVKSAAKGERPDLILIDLWIPGLSGEKVIRGLKQAGDTKRIPIVIVSAQRDLPAVVKKTGADGYLAKPFDLEKLLATVHQYLASD